MGLVVCVRGNINITDGSVAILSKNGIYVQKYYSFKIIPTISSTTATFEFCRDHSIVNVTKRHSSFSDHLTISEKRLRLKGL